MIAVVLAVALAAVPDDAPALPAPPALLVEAPAAPSDAMATATTLLQQGHPGAATSNLLAGMPWAKEPPERRARVAALLGQAADALDEAGEVKAAAVAADASWQLLGRPTDPRLSLLVSRYARSLVDSDDAGALALAERAQLMDPDNVDSRAVAAEMVGRDTWVPGHLTLLGGAGLAAVSATAFVAGFEVERQMHGALHSTAEVDRFLLQRGIAGAVAWPTLAGAVVATGVGLALVVAHDPGPVPELPAPFAPLSPTPEEP